MFGRRNREATQDLLDTARVRLDQSAQQTAALVDAVTALNATVSAEMERSRRLGEAGEAAARALQQAVTNQSHDVSGALEHVAAMYALLAERIDDDRDERRTFVEALVQLAEPREVAAPKEIAEPARPRVLGGSVFATPANEPREIARPDAVDVVSDAPFDIGDPFNIGDAVCCRFGDQWIDGVDIVEAVGNPTKPAYRLRRRQDGYVLPALFGARDLRLASNHSQDAAADTGTESRGRWARS